MMTIAMGAAGSLAEGRAMAVYMLEQQIPTEAMRAAAYYGQTPGVEEAIAAGYGVAPLLRNDVDPALAEALGLKPGQSVSGEELACLLSGHRADGQPLPLELHQHREVTTYGNAEDGSVSVRHRVAYLDLTFSSPKDLGLGWAFADTEAERNALLQAHRTARDEALRYIEKHMIRAAVGDGGKGGYVPGRMVVINVDHFTARPTLETVRTDPATGEVFTELHSAKVSGDMEIHSHALIPNFIIKPDGKFAAIDATAFHGRVHEGGAVYQAVLARELTALNVANEQDRLTNMVRIPAIEERAIVEFSRRSREGEREARKRAEREGRNWDEMTPEQRATLKKVGTHATRLNKETNTPDMQAWHARAARIGWTHQTVIAPEPLPTKTREERMNIADRVGMEHLSAMLTQRAVIGQGDVRLAAARGFIAAGGLEHTDDIDLMMRHWAKLGVLQDGHDTKLIWKDVPGRGIRITTELHRDQERELISLVQDAALDRRHALTPAEIEAAVLRTGLSYAGPHGNSQRDAVETVGTDGAVSVVIGVAGSGKSTHILKPLVNAWEARGFDVHGTAQAWRQAKDLRGAGIRDNRALDPFLDSIHAGRLRLDENSIVVLDELGRIGTRQLLDLKLLRAQYGFKLVLLGDDEQAQSIEAGPVVDLLREALGSKRIPEILTTVRQETEREQELAGMFRAGQIKEAIAAKRADGTAELVHGGYRQAVERVADLYIERRQATQNRGSRYRVTVSAPTNADAREIGREIREMRRALGEIGPDVAHVDVTDGRGTAATMDLASGDRVRLFASTRGIFVDAKGRRRSASVGDNGTILDVVTVDRREGLQLRGESGKVAFVSWAALKDRGGSGRLLLGSGEVMTIDTSQGITTDEHIDAFGGSDGFKAYVGASRHRVRHYFVGSMGAEMREVRARRMAGLPKMTPKEEEAAAWANLVRRFERRPKKESALEMIGQISIVKRNGAKALQGALLRHERREKAGQQATTVQDRRNIRDIREAIPQMAEGLAEVSKQQTRTADILDRLTTAPVIVKQRQPRRINITEVEAQQQFKDELSARGFRIKGLPTMDGNLHYAPTDRDKGNEKSGAYKGFYGDDRPPSGSIYKFREGGFIGNWTAHGETVPISVEEAAARAARAAEQDATRAAERIERETAGAVTAAALISGARLADASHPYLVRKDVNAHGIYVANPGQTITVTDEDGTARERSIAGMLLVPLRNAEGEIRNVQTISDDGRTKLYLKGAQKMGTFHILGDWAPGQPIGLAEGYATAATAHRALGIPVAMALDTSNLTAAALALRQLSPDGRIYMLADNDHHLPLREKPLANAGLEKATKAAEVSGAIVLLAPELPERAAINKGTDWNDFEVLRGQRAVVVEAGRQAGLPIPPRPVVEAQRAAMSM